MRMKDRHGLALSLATLLIIAMGAGCSDDSDDNDNIIDPPPPDPGATTVIYRFDDSVNGTYTSSDGLALAGLFVYDADTGELSRADTYAGPFPMLYDDGPAAAGGHEAAGEAAGDHIWTMSAEVPTADSDWTFTIYPVRDSVDGSPGMNLWPDSGLDLTVPAGANDPLVVAGPSYVPPQSSFTPVTFTIDDAANASYTAADGLAWKGSFSFDPATRVLTSNASWGGPFVTLHDDGPWTLGGHEPLDHAAGDHVWSVAVWVDNSLGLTFEYGAIAGSVDGSDGTWIWQGANGIFTVMEGQQTEVHAEGMVIPAWGNVDFLITMDLSNNGANLEPSFQGVDYTADSALKGGFTGWNTVTLQAMPELGQDIYGFRYSENLGPHEGLLHSGDVLEWVMVLGEADYRVDGEAQYIGLAISTIVDGNQYGGFYIRTQPSGNRNLTFTLP